MAKSPCRLERQRSRLPSGYNGHTADRQGARLLKHVGFREFLAIGRGGLEEKSDGAVCKAQELPMLSFPSSERELTDLLS